MSTPTQAAPRSDSAVKANPPAAASDSKGRGRKPGTVAKERAEIPADEMQLILLPEKQKADLRRKREERKPQQKAVDQVIWNIFQQNVETGFDNGNINNWADLFVYDWAVTKTHYETALFMIKKATDLYYRKPIYGEQVEIPANKSHLIPDASSEDEDAEMPCHLNGKDHVHVPFSVVRRPRRRVTQ